MFGKNRVDALDRICDRLLADAAAFARKFLADNVPRTWPQLPRCEPNRVDQAGYSKLLEMELSWPDHPVNWHRRAVAEALNQPRALQVYFTMRRNLWLWPEFQSLPSKARIILDIVIELAREEAFPWFLNVKAREVQRLARTNHETMANSLRELECMTITRPARRIELYPHELYDGTRNDYIRGGALPRWPSTQNNWGVPADAPLREIPQWVVRYRRGVPRNANRAAWWINYDLLCGTQRVLPCFEMSVNSLPRTYEGRNHRMGDRPDFLKDAGFRQLERGLAQSGPLPPIGLRAPLWEGMAYT